MPKQPLVTPQQPLVTLQQSLMMPQQPLVMPQQPLVMPQQSLMMPQQLLVMPQHPLVMPPSLKPSKIYENRLKSVQNDENGRKSMDIFANLIKVKDPYRDDNSIEKQYVNTDTIALHMCDKQPK